MIYIGIDPGKDGALAIISEDGLSEAIPYDTQAYKSALSGLQGPSVAVLEHVNAMPKQGVTSMFNFGEGFGYLKGLLDAYGIPYELVRPQKWKKEFGISGKNQSIEVCKRLFPGVNLKKTDRCKKDHDGMAEALLMAEYARRHF